MDLATYNAAKSRDDLRSYIYERLGCVLSGVLLWDDDEGGVDNDADNGEDDDDAMVWQSINGKDTQSDCEPVGGRRGRRRR